MLYTCHSEPWRYFSGREYECTDYLIKKNNLQIVALHRTMQKEINKLLKINNTIVLENWIDFSRFKGVRESQQEIRFSLGIPREAFVIGTIGRIVGYKNQVFLVDVLNHIITEKPNSLLLIAGEGTEVIKDGIVQRARDYGIEDRVVFLGIRKDVERVYKALDVFMLPSFIEGFPVVAVEAQVSGVKCVLSDRVPKEVCLSKSTFFLPLDDSGKWSACALQTGFNDGHYGDINNYNINIGIKKLERLYSDLSN